MSVMIYMTVTVDGGQVTPVVHVSSFQRLPYSESNSAHGDIPLEEVRRGLEVTSRIIGFAEGLRREP